MGIPADVQLPEMLVSVAADELCQSEPDESCHGGYNALTGACATCRRRARTVGRELYDAGQARGAVGVGGAPSQGAGRPRRGGGRGLPLLPETMSHIRAGAVTAARDSGLPVTPDAPGVAVIPSTTASVDETYAALKGESGRSHLHSSWARWWRRDSVDAALRS